MQLQQQQNVGNDTFQTNIQRVYNYNMYFQLDRDRFCLNDFSASSLWFFSLFELQ